MSGERWYEVTVRRSRAAFARFGESVLVTGATVRCAYARSELEFDCLVGVPAHRAEDFREIAQAVYMGPPSRINVNATNTGER